MSFIPGFLRQGAKKNLNHYFVTVSVTAVLCCKLPLVPAMVSVNMPLRLPAVTVIVVVPDPVTEVGLKLALASRGNPVTPKVTAPVHPFNGVTVTLYVVLCSRATRLGDGVAESEKSAPGLATTSVTEAVRCRPPLVPVMINE